MGKIYFHIMAVILVISALIGFLLPFLYSAKSTELFFIGIGIAVAIPIPLWKWCKYIHHLVHIQKTKQILECKNEEI